jgi:hypothetical protein
MPDLPVSKPAGQVAEQSTGRLAEFMERVKAQPHRGRLAFIVDATASREAAWDLASKLQAEMFEAAATLGTLQLQLTFFRGAGSAAECKHSPWISDGRKMAELMGKISCRGGFTQIQRALRHVAGEHRRQPISACVYIDDQCEEDAGTLIDAVSGLDVKLFVFGEGADANATPIFKELARATGGAYAPFDAGSAAQLRELLRAVAVFAAGGLAALQDRHNEAAIKLLTQMRGPPQKGGTGGTSGTGGAGSR